MRRRLMRPGTETHTHRVHASTRLKQKNKKKNSNSLKHVTHENKLNHSVTDGLSGHIRAARVGSIYCSLYIVRLCGYLCTESTKREREKQTVLCI